MVSGGIVSRRSAVFVMIDMQHRLADAMPRRDEVVGTSVLLAHVASALGIPVIVTRQYPAGLGDTVLQLVDALGPHEPVDKTSFDCTLEPAFRAKLDASGRHQVVLAGMEAHICVTQTALALASIGREVYVVADAVCSRRDVDCDIALHRLRAAGVVVATAESVIYEALGRAGTPEFKAVLELVKAHPIA